MSHAQVVAGINYHLIMVVRDANNNEHDVAATVWSRPWLATRNEGGDDEDAWTLTDAHVVEEGCEEDP